MVGAGRLKPTDPVTHPPAVSILFASTALAGVPSLVGGTILRVSQPQLTGEIINPELALVQDPGHEYADVIIGDPFRTIDVGPDYIRYQSLSSHYSPWFDSGFPASYIEFRDLDFSGPPGTVIGGVEVEWSSPIHTEDGAPLGHPAFSAAAVTWNADTIRLTTGPYVFPEGSFVHIRILTVPAPGAAGVLALVGALAVRRRRTCG